MDYRSGRPLRILVVPLDWGLGHTIRCIPIITALLNKNVEVILSGNAMQKKILHKRFPQCLFLPLDGYNVAYAKAKPAFALKLLCQLPHLISVTKLERKWLAEMIKEYKLDGVVSDNRFGLHNSQIPCVFITHQLHIRSGIGNFADAVLEKINYRKINNFNYCWVPDFDGQPNLAGTLSHPKKLPAINCNYIGPLSETHQSSTMGQQGYVLFVISGPEPQRSIFEKIIFQQVANYEMLSIVVRGLPVDTNTPTIKNAIIYNYLPKTEITQLMGGAKAVICRSGYTSVMDVNEMKAKCVFVPTPGQTEQEYLARHLHTSGFAPYFPQNKFNLRKALERADSFVYNGYINTEPYLLIKAIEQFLQDCEV